MQSLNSQLEYNGMWGISLRLRTVTILVTLALVLSLGTNVYLYMATKETQKTTNNIRAELIFEWASRMDIAASYLRNVTTNIDVAEQYGVRYYLLSAYQIIRFALVEESGELSFYQPLYSASLDTARNLIEYEEGAQTPPTVERRINITAIQMFDNLADKIQNVTALIFEADQQYLARLSGENPMQLLEEKGVRDDLMQGCSDISYYSLKIAEFETKFE